MVGEGQTEMMMNDAPTILNPNLAPTVETTPLQDAVKACQVSTLHFPTTPFFVLHFKNASGATGLLAYCF